METIPAYLNATDLAKLFGMSTRGITLLNEQGVLRRGKSGLFDVRQAISEYVHYRATPKNKETAENLRAEKLKAETEHIQLKTAVAKGDLLDAQQVKSEWAQAGGDLRSSILAVPSRVGAACGLDRAVVAQIDAELRECLGAIADAIAAVPETGTENPSAPPKAAPEPQDAPEPPRPARRDVIGRSEPLPESPSATDSRRRAARKAARAARRVSALPV